MSPLKIRILQTILVLLLLPSLILILLFFKQYHSLVTATHTFNGTILNNKIALKPFTLMGIDKKPFNNDALHGQWSMIFFGFTHCGSLCPTTLAQLAKMYHLLEAQQVTPLPRVVIISLDPDRDHLDTIKRYVHAFNPHFYGARGDVTVLKKMTQTMGIAFTKVTSKNNASYDIQHSGTILGINPQGQLEAFFTSSIDATQLAYDYQHWIKHS